MTVRTAALAAIAVVAFVLAGALAAVGPYAGVRSELAQLETPRPPLEERPIEDAAALDALRAGLGADGRARYRRQIGWDLVVIAANATWPAIWLAAVARGTFGRSRPVAGAAVGLALLPAALDLLENLALVRLLADQPDPAWIPVAAAATSAKMAAMALAVLAALAGTIAVIVRQVRGRRRAASGAPTRVQAVSP